MRVFNFLWVLLFLFSCNSDVKSYGNAKSDSVTESNQLTSLGNSDTLTISAESAVFIEADSNRITDQRKLLGEESFQIGLDDYAFYTNEAFEFFKSQGLPVAETKNKSVIKFIKSNGEIHLVRKDTLEDLWSFYLFDPERHPTSVDMTMIEEEYHAYFQKGGG